MMGDLFPILMIMIVSALLGFMVGLGINDVMVRQEAIERGFAEWSDTNGEWQWKGGKDDGR